MNTLKNTRSIAPKLCTCKRDGEFWRILAEILQGLLNFADTHRLYKINLLSFICIYLLYYFESFI